MLVSNAVHLNFACMFYCLVINVHQCCLSVVCISNSFILSHAVLFVNNFFIFFCFPLFQRRLCKTSIFDVFVVVVRDSLFNIHHLFDKSQQLILHFFQTVIFDQNAQIILPFLCIFTYIVFIITQSRTLHRYYSFLHRKYHLLIP